MADVEQFIRVVVEVGREFTAFCVSQIARTEGTSTQSARHGILNLVVAVSRVLVDGDVRQALESTDAAALAGEVDALSKRAATGVRGLLSRCRAGGGRATGRPRVAPPVGAACSISRRSAEHVIQGQGHLPGTDLGVQTTHTGAQPWQGDRRDDVSYPAGRARQRPVPP